MNHDRFDRQEKVLLKLCSLIETGMTLNQLSASIGKSLSSIHLYLDVLQKAGVERKFKGKGSKGGPRIIVLVTPHKKAKELLHSYFEQKNTKQSTFRKIYGAGIESWLFISHERAASYKVWCESWTKD